MAATETITLRLVATDLISGNVTKAIGSLDKLAKQGGLVGSVLQGVGQSFGQMLNPVALVANGIGMATDVMRDSIAAASDQNEALSKVNVVFEDQAGIIDRWARGAASAMGMSETAALKAAGTFGNLFDGLGIAEEAAVDMSKSVVQLAADLGSFNNVATDDALQALQSGLLGEAEPMRRFGVALSEAKVQAFGMAHGLGAMVKSGKTFKFVMTDAEKVQARWGIILENTKNAQGDFARTSEGLANSQKTLTARIDDLQVQLGEFLIGPATDFTQWLSDVIAGGASADEQVKAYIRTLVKTKGAAGESGDALKNLHDGLVALDDILQPQVDEALDFARSIKAIGDEAEVSDRQIAELFFVFKDQMHQGSEQAKRSVLSFLRSLTDMNQGVRSFGDVVLHQMGVGSAQVVKGMGEMTMSVEDFVRSTEALDDKGWSEWSRFLAKNVDFVNEHFEDLPKYLQDAAAKADVVLGETWARVVGGVGSMVDDMGANVRRAPSVFREALAPLAGIVKGTLKQAKEQAKRDMADLAWALKHPMEDSKIKQVWVGELRGAYKALHRAQETNNRIAIAKAQALIDGLRAKIFELDMAQLAIRVDYTLRGTERPLGNPPPPPRAKGGPVSAGGTYLVGEEGPELLTLGTSSGHVTPNHALGGVHVHLHGFLAAPTEAETARVARVIGPAIRREMARAGA